MVFIMVSVISPQTWQPDSVTIVFVCDNYSHLSAVFNKIMTMY